MKTEIMSTNKFIAWAIVINFLALVVIVGIYVLLADERETPEIVELQDNQEVFYAIHQTVTTWQHDVGTIKRDTIYLTSKTDGTDVDELWGIVNIRLYYKENPVDIMEILYPKK